MDISVIQAKNTNLSDGLKWGADTAPVKILEFVNVRCPYCKRWFEETDELLSQYVAEGKLQRVIKLFDKEKPSLQKGNALHQYIPYHDAAASHDALVQIYATQRDWADQEIPEVIQFAENKLGLTKQDNREVAAKIVKEAAAANIQFVPTVILGQHIFDESITPDELAKLIDTALTEK